MARISVILEVLTFIIALLGYAPLYPYLETVPRFFLPLALVGGALARRKGLRLSASLATVVSIVFFFFYAAQFSRDNLAAPAVNLLVALLSVRLLSEKKVRHYLQIFALSLFSLAGSSLFTLDLQFLFYLVLLVFLIAAALVILTFHSVDENLTLSGKGARTLLSVAFLIPAGAMPLMCVFFMILPRTQYPLWNFMNVAGSRVAGFSEKVQPGAAASVGEVRKVSFRVECEQLAPEKLYWRGTVLNRPTADSWVRGEPPAGEFDIIKGGAGGVRQVIYPEPGRLLYLYALNVPFRIWGVRVAQSGDLVFKTPSFAARRVKYEVVSLPGSAIRARQPVSRAFYLQLPQHLSPRLAAVAGEIAKKGKSDEEKLELLKGYFASRNLSYATSGLPVSAAPLDEFLFEKKRGNCEFFASSFALLLRMAGVPSRLVGGYFGGEYNELGGYYLVTEEMAHVWVEAYLAGRGWVTFDPSGLATNFRTTREKRTPDLAFRIRMFLDSCSYYWNMAVIAYDLEKQIQLAGRINFRMRHLSFPAHPGRALLLIGAPLILLAMGAAATRRRKTSREEEILRKFLRIMKRKHGMDILPSTGLQELASRSGDPRVAEFVAVYGGAVYHDRKLSDAEYRLLRGVLRELS